MKTTALAAALLALVAIDARADVYVIANPALTVGAEDVVDVFTGEKQLAGGVKLVPIDNAAAQAEFLDKVLHMNAAKYGALWTKKAFREGLNAPPVRGSDLEVAGAVKSTPGGIGYVTAPVPGVTVIRKY